MNHVLRLRELSSVGHCHPPSPSPTSEPLDLTLKDKCLDTKPQLSDRTLRTKDGKVSKTNTASTRAQPKGSFAELSSAQSLDFHPCLLVTVTE